VGAGVSELDFRLNNGNYWPMLRKGIWKNTGLQFFSTLLKKLRPAVGQAVEWADIHQCE
jgi:hypothetical protein